MSASDAATKSYYQIRVQGRLDEGWAVWFEGMEVSVESSQDGLATTIIAGPVLDQAALYGLLSRVRDLGLPLLLVKREEPKRVKDVGNEGLVIE